MSWGNGNKGPWGNVPNGGGGGQRPEPPKADLDDILRKSKDNFNQIFGGGDNKRVVVLGLLIICVLWLASGFYRVNPDELGVVLRFGKYHRTTSPGLNYHAPFPVETVLIPSVTSVNKVEVGFRSGFSDRTTRSFDKESLMLTGDRNIVDIDFEVQWKIDSGAPQNYLFNVRDPATMIKPVAESAMREVIARNDLADVLTTAQSQIAEDTKEIMQQMLDDYRAGIEVISVNLSRPDVPAPVIDEFQDVKRAEQDKETAESVAEGYRNDIIPKAKGRAVQMVQQATAYKNKVIAEAEGDVARFISVYDEYKLAKDVTRKRMYLETMEDVLGGMNKIIIDGDSGGVLPYLPLDGLQPKRRN
ncbi:MAG: FtsH protease activity modulator HflK [Rickettsiales bacterium]|nr:FtsH protease activity modulator HflK [Rickettsiales bacterium]